MGYSTDFNGEFTLDRPLISEHLVYLKMFNETRRMQRNSAIAETLPDPIRVAAGLPIGFQGEYFVGGSGSYGQDGDASVTDHSESATTQPGLWCKWTASDDGATIKWDGAEKFYRYVGWLSYITNHFLVPWGYNLNGEVSWQGEEPDDRGIIYVKNNRIQAIHDEMMNPGPDWGRPDWGDGTGGRV